MGPKIPTAGRSIPIAALENDASIRSFAPAEAELARRADAIAGDGDGDVSDAKLNTFITELARRVLQRLAAPTTWQAVYEPQSGVEYSPLSVGSAIWLLPSKVIT